MSAERINQLAEDIHSAVTELSDGAVYPDLSIAINALRDAAVAAQPAQPAPSQPVAASEVVAEHGQLDPRRAYETAQNMLRYVEAFNGQEWALSTLGGNVDRKNLAVALDNLQECAAMLLNQSDRLRAALSAPQPAAQVQAQAVESETALTKLAKFGAAMLHWHRGDNPGESGDVDAITCEEEALRCGVLEGRNVDAPCCESCVCAPFVGWEVCYFTPDDIRAQIDKFDAARTASPGREGAV